MRIPADRSAILSPIFNRDGIPENRPLTFPYSNRRGSNARYKDNMTYQKSLSIEISTNFLFGEPRTAIGTKKRANVKLFFKYSILQYLVKLVHIQPHNPT